MYNNETVAGIQTTVINRPINDILIHVKTTINVRYTLHSKHINFNFNHLVQYFNLKYVNRLKFVIKTIYFNIEYSEISRNKEIDATYSSHNT